jgi:hypothetical protein
VKSEDDETVAAKRLAAAKTYQTTAPDVAKKWLKEIVDKWPETKAADEARKLLEE